MLLKDILCERISLTPYNKQLHKDLTKIVLTTTKKILETSDLSNLISGMIAIRSNVEKDLVDNLSKYLKGKIKDITEKNINVKFVKLPNGDASYVDQDSTMYINDAIIKGISRKVIPHVYNTISGNIKPELLDDVNKLISTLISFFLHELTHVIQLKSSGKPYEKSHIHDKEKVDSYLKSIDLDTKSKRRGYKGDKQDLNKHRLNVFLSRVLDPESDMSQRVYRAQPEEIGAYSQQVANDIVNSISKLPSKRQLKSINQILDDIKNNKTDISIVKKYADVGKDNIKVYQKFLKQLYQELDTYRDSLVK